MWKGDAWDMTMDVTSEKLTTQFLLVSSNYTVSKSAYLNRIDIFLTSSNQHNNEQEYGEG